FGAPGEVEIRLDLASGGPTRYAIEGVVVDDESGEPLQGHTVRALEPGAGQREFGLVLTDSRGAFALAFEGEPARPQAGSPALPVPLRIEDPRGAELRVEDVLAGGEAASPLSLRVPRPAAPPAPSPSVAEIAKQAGVVLPEEVRSQLEAQQ